MNNVQNTCAGCVQHTLLAIACDIAGHAAVRCSTGVADNASQVMTALRFYNYVGICAHAEAGA